MVVLVPVSDPREPLRAASGWLRSSYNLWSALMDPSSVQLVIVTRYDLVADPATGQFELQSASMAATLEPKTAGSAPAPRARRSTAPTPS